MAIRAGAQGIGFAIPVDSMLRVAAEMLSIRKRNSTWHGVVGRDCVGERSFNYDLAHVRNGYELSSRRSEFAFILKLIGDDAGNWRTNSGIAKLRVECRNTLLRLCDFRGRQRKVIWIKRLCAQRYGLLGETQLVFSGR